MASSDWHFAESERLMRKALTAAEEQSDPTLLVNQAAVHAQLCEAALEAETRLMFPEGVVAARETRWLAVLGDGS